MHPRPTLTRPTLSWLRHRLAPVLAAATLAPMLVLTTATAATAAPAPDDLPRYQPQVSCDPGAKPGSIGLRNLILSRHGGSDLGISRACNIGSTSEHKEGRGWDWGLNAAKVADRKRANAALSWLTRTEDGVTAANARRLGVMYIIWNKRMWRAYDPARGWTPYTGASPHTDHVHFSLTWNGAMKRTSWWTGKAMPLDHGPCVRWHGELAPKWTKPRLDPCPPPLHRPTINTDGTYTAQHGETLGRVARFFGHTWAEIRAWNHFPATGPVTITPGQRVRVVPLPDWQGYYTVQRGNTIAQIAGYFAVTGPQLRRWNNLPATGPAGLYPGQQLLVTEGSR